MHIKLKVFFGGNSKFGIKNKFLDTGNCPAPDIEGNYQQSDHAC